MSADPYEDEAMLAQYLLFHYGSLEETLPFSFGPKEAWNFPARVTELFDLSSLPGNARALDLGCAVGASSFALSRHCAEVVGIDYSRQFIHAAERLAKGEVIPYERLEEGELSTPLRAKAPGKAHLSRVRFLHGDAMSLPENLGAFDLLLAANLLCRLPEPERCLARLPQLIKPGGQLLITSPWTWLDAYTPKANWLGGRIVADRPIVSIQALEAALRADFSLRSIQDLPLLIREHARKYQWTVSQASLWIRH